MALTLSGDDGVAGVNGSATTPAIQGTDTNTGLTFGTDTVNIVTGGSERFKIGSAGQLGIGGATYGTDGHVLTSTGASSAPAWEALPSSGKILQVVQGSHSTNTAISTNAPTYTSTGLDAAITPSATSSKILVLVNLSFYLGSTSADNAGFGVKIDRTISSTTTDIYTNSGTGYSIFIEGSAAPVNMYSRIGYNLLDSPSTTSEATYEVHVGRYQSSTNLGINPGPTANTSHITLIEVAA